VKLIKSDRDKFAFHLGKREKQLLLAVLDRYPLIPSAHQSLSKSTVPGQTEADQRMLDEALAEQRQENKRQLQRLLNDEQRLRDTETGCRLTLTAPDIEWLLQVLNEVRVGSWILLGSPEKNLWDFELNKETAPHAWAMEMAGFFQAGLLAALRPGDAT
jgi:hypothetical protein